MATSGPVARPARTSLPIEPPLDDRRQGMERVDHTGCAHPDQDPFRPFSPGSSPGRSALLSRSVRSDRDLRAMAPPVRRRENSLAPWSRTSTVLRHRVIRHLKGGRS